MHSIQLPVVRLNQEHQLYTYQTKIFEPKDQCNRPFAILSVYAPKSFRSRNSKCISNAIASFGKPQCTAMRTTVKTIYRLDNHKCTCSICT